MISAKEARAESDSFAEKTSVQAVYTAIEPELMQTIEEEIHIATANGEMSTGLDLGDLIRCLITRYLTEIKIRNWWTIYDALAKCGDLSRIYKMVEIALKSLGYEVNIGEQDDEWIAPKHRAKKWLTISWDNEE